MLFETIFVVVLPFCSHINYYRLLKKKKKSSLADKNTVSFQSPTFFFWHNFKKKKKILLLWTCVMKLSTVFNIKSQKSKVYVN